MKISRRHFVRNLTLVAGAAVVAPAAGCVCTLGQAKFGARPHGDRLARIRRSPHWHDGRFWNLEPTPQLTGDKSRVRTGWDFAFGSKKGVVPDVPIPAIKTDLKSLPPDRDLLVWFGHSSYLLQLGGRRYLVDPVFYAAAPYAFMGRPFPGTDIYKPADLPDIDTLVITHDHWDHLDYRTVTELRGRIGRIVCPLGVGSHFARWEFPESQLVELDWNEDAVLPSGAVFHCLPQRHFSGRGLVSCQTLWASFVLEADGRRIFIGGDGGYGRHFKAIGAQFPGLDLAILEDGQYNPDWCHIHTMPQFFPSVVKDLAPRRVLAVHHLKYALSMHPWHEPVEVAERAAQSTGVPFLFPEIGEVVPLT